MFVSILCDLAYNRDVNGCTSSMGECDSRVYGDILMSEYGEVDGKEFIRVTRGGVLNFRSGVCAWLITAYGYLIGINYYNNGWLERADNGLCYYDNCGDGCCCCCCLGGGKRAPAKPRGDIILYL